MFLSIKDSTFVLRLVPWGKWSQGVRLMAWENLNLRMGELGFVVLQKEGHKVKTLRGGGSFRCS
jgi:hypothetical protein